MKNEIPVLFMANDESLSQVKIFLTNFRQFNPKTPLFLIPLGTQIDSMLACQDEFNFSVVDYDFSEIDALPDQQRCSAPVCPGLEAVANPHLDRVVISS